MAWYGKEQSSPFDNARFEGLFFIDGDLLARRIPQDWTKGEKAPMLMFPSRVICEVWASGKPEQDGCIVHLFGEMDLPFYGTRERAYTQAMDIAEQVGYLARKVGDTQLELIGHDDEEHVLVSYDDTAQRMVDVALVQAKRTREIPRPMPLLTDEIRAKLPTLYANEKIGMDALAQVKFFTPDSSWTWYVSEGAAVDENGFFDTDKPKVDFLFYGVVAGLEVELGYFSLSQLEGIRGRLGLPVERDLDFEPTKLRELKAKHEREQGE